MSGLCAGYPGPGRDVMPVLHDVDLVVPEGELLAVLGPSGCGKTTLLRVLAGLMGATAGRVELAGRRVVDGPHGVPPERRRVGLVPQDASLFPHLDVAENIGFGLDPKRIRLPFGRRRAVPERVAELLQLVGIPELAHRMPSELSGGQAQRVALARALAPEPDLVLLDEPFSALDAALRTRLRTDVRDILRDSGATGLLVTHDQDEALSTADRIAVLDAGRIVQCGTPEEVYARPATAWVAQFVGTCSLLRGRVGRAEGAPLDTGAAAGATTVSCALGTTSAPTGAGALTESAKAESAQADSAKADSAQADSAQAEAGQSETPVLVMVRPEQVRLAPAGEAGAPATVTSVEYSGHSTMYHMLLDGPGAEELAAREHGPARFAIGDRVTATAESPLHVVAAD